MIARIVFFVSALVLVAAASLLIGLYSGFKRTALLDFAVDVYLDAREVVAEFETQSGLPVKFIQPQRGRGVGVTIDETRPDDGFVLLSGYIDGTNRVRLIRRDGAVLADWPLSYRTLFPDVSYLVNPPLQDWDVDLHGVVIEKDGSIVVNFEYVGAVSLTRCGDVRWALRHPTHHSVEIAEGGGYWIPGRIEHQEIDPGTFPPFTEVVDYAFREDLILKVSETGEILQRKSVGELLYENGFEQFLTATGYSFRNIPGQTLGGTGTWVDEELVHLNKIGELGADMADRFPQFEAGDLIMSLRNRNFVFVVDPDTWRIKWHKTGPWRRQHDPEFTDDGTIVLFNNDVYLSSYDPPDPEKPETLRGSDILRVDPASGELEVLYGEAAGEDLLTYIRGKVDVRPNGHLVITEFEGGRVFETDPFGNIVWEYVNGFDDERVGELTEGRVYPAGYFDVADWSCLE